MSDIYYSTEYRNAHKRITRTRGPASNYFCIACGSPARHWAYRYGDADYSDNPGDYDPMCVSCHRRTDWSYKSDEQRKTRMVRARAFNNTYSRRCSDCGLTSTAAGVASHLRGSGHTGYEVVV